MLREMNWCEKTSHELIAYSKSFKISIIVKGSKLNSKGSVLDIFKLNDVVHSLRHDHPKDTLATPSVLAKMIHEKIKKLNSDVKAKIRVYESGKSSEYGDRV